MIKREFQDNLADMTALQTASPMSAMRSAFGQSHLPHEEVSFIHKLARFNDNLELLGQQSGNIESRVEKGFRLARSVTEATNAVRQRAKRSFDTQMLLSMLQDRSQELGLRIARAETGFEDRYGDAWREMMANRILDPDEIPERRDGESMEDYRARLEDELINKMIDPETGEIRPEYLQDPEIAEWAQWAKDEYDKRQVDAEIEQANEIENDPDLSREEKDTRLETQFEDMGSDRLDLLRQEGGLSSSGEQIARATEDANLDQLVGSVDANSTIGGFG